MKLIQLLFFLISANFASNSIDDNYGVLTDGQLFYEPNFYVNLNALGEAVFMPYWVDGVVSNIFLIIPKKELNLGNCVENCDNTNPGDQITRKQKLQNDFNKRLNSTEKPTTFFIRVTNGGDTDLNTSVGTYINGCIRKKIKSVNFGRYIKVTNYNWEKDNGYIEKLLNPNARMRVTAATCQRGKKTFNDGHIRNFYELDHNYYKTGFIFVYEEDINKIPSQLNPFLFADYNTYMTRIYKWQLINFNLVDNYTAAEIKECKIYPKCVRTQDSDGKGIIGTSEIEINGIPPALSEDDAVERNRKFCTTDLANGGFQTNCYTRGINFVNLFTSPFFINEFYDQCCPLRPIILTLNNELNTCLL